MNSMVFKVSLMAVALGFTVFFAVTIIPPLIANPDLFAALAAGFVNPYAAGYSTDVILCWVVLAIWVMYDAQHHGVRKGWVCLLLGLLPGVAVGFAVYLLMRTRQFGTAQVKVS